MIQVMVILIILKEALLVLHVEKKKGLYFGRYQFAYSEYRSIMVSTEASLSKSTISRHKASACTIIMLDVKYPA